MSCCGSIHGRDGRAALSRRRLPVAADDEAELTFHIQTVIGNRSARGAGRCFKIKLADVGLKEPVTCAVEIGESTKSVETLLEAATTSGRQAVKRDAAKESILRELAAAPQPMDYLRARCAVDADASGDTTWKAADELKAAGKVQCKNSGPGTPWLWSLTSASGLADFGAGESQEDTDYVLKSGVTS